MPTVIERIEAKTTRTGTCWLWHGTIEKKTGYGRIRIGGRKGRVLMVHRVLYQEVNGPIPDALLVDHKCHVHNCVNPKHLRAVTPKVNSEHRLPAGNCTNTSGVRGVSWAKTRNKWLALVGHQGKQHFIGYFTELKDAEAAVIQRRNEWHTGNLHDRAE